MPLAGTGARRRSRAVGAPGAASASRTASTTCAVREGVGRVLVRDADVQRASQPTGTPGLALDGVAPSEQPVEVVLERADAREDPLALRARILATEERTCPHVESARRTGARS